MKYLFQQYEAPVILYNHLNLGGNNPEGERIDVNSAYFTRNGKPWIPVMGEFHFSRYDRNDWYEELCKMKAGGITLVSTYLFWIYHEEIEGSFDFTGDNDIRAFIDQCKRAGLEVVIRIGPWAHGECRNGGLPDWLLKKPYKLRENNEAYLEQVKKWYSKIYEQVKGFFYQDGGNIVAIQLENEFCHDAAHLARLKEIAIDCGLVAPLYTVTGWNSAAGAKIPVDEVVPVFGGYCDAPWDHSLKQLPPSPHYFFNRMRNDSAIGADLLPKEGDDDWQLPYERYPFATCELGGGIQVTHHRRPIIKGMDIYAISLIKLGDGNNLVGYYMYHGGTNKIGQRSTLQESKATGYPNDYAILSYDFQGPISEYGEIRDQYRLLNLLHLFLEENQETFATMTAVDAINPVTREDMASLRYGMRTNGRSGFVFINHYQRLAKLEDVKDVVIDTGNVVFPSFDVCGDISFFFPFHMDLGGNDLTYATAQPICKQDNTYFFVAIPGIKPEYQVNGNVYKPEVGKDFVLTVNEVNIVTLSWAEAQFVRKIKNTVYIGENCDLYGLEDVVACVGEGDYTYYVWKGKCFATHTINRKSQEVVVTMREVDMPKLDQIYYEELHMGGEREVVWREIRVSGSNGMVEINYIGDVAQIYADGKLIADDYYYGKVWRVPARLLFGKTCYLAVSELRDDFYREF